SNHVIVTVIFGESKYEAVAIVEPYGISSKLTVIIFVLLCWKCVHSGKFIHIGLCTCFITSKEYQHYRWITYITPSLLAKSGVINVDNLTRFYVGNLRRRNPFKFI